MVLSGCRPEAAVAWAGRGLAPLTVASVDDWTVVMPAGRPAARSPYDEAVRVLAGRPVGLRMRPALGFFQLGRQAVITVHPARWRAVQRWAVWTPRDALVHLPDLPVARPIDIVEAARTLPAEALALAEREIRGILQDGARDAPGVILATLATLGLPGAEVLSGRVDITTLPGSQVVVPNPRHARAFDRVLTEETRHRAELET